MTRKEFYNEIKKKIIEIGNHIDHKNKTGRKIIDECIVLIAKAEEKEKTTNRKQGAYKATETRIKRAKEKIKNAIKQLKEKEQNITAYKVAKEAKISYNTAKKYINN